MIKWSKKREQYENSTKTNIIKGNDARSYGHWLYVTVINGVRIMNNTYYSSTTCKHQRDAYDHFYSFDIVLNHVNNSLDNKDGVLSDLNDAIVKIRKAIDKPRSHKAKNSERYAEIQSIQSTINKLTECGFFRSSKKLGKT